LEYKSLTLEEAQFKARPKEKTFEGYAATFGNRDLVGDVIHKGAFDKTVAERGPGAEDMIKILWDHFDPFGMPKSFKNNDVGLYMVGKALNLSTTDDRMEMMAGGLYKHMSIGYVPIEDKVKWDEDGTRHLHEVKLYEVSVVMFPANEMAAMVSVRKAAELDLMVKGIGRGDLIDRARHLKGVDLGRIDNALQALSELAADLRVKASEAEKPGAGEAEPTTSHAGAEEPEAGESTTPSEASEAGEARETQDEEPEETKALEGEILSFIDEIRLLNEVKSLRK
jgi:HK97 family phage prohead protease